MGFGKDGAAWLDERDEERADRRGGRFEGSPGPGDAWSSGACTAENGDGTSGLPKVGSGGPDGIVGG